MKPNTCLVVDIWEGQTEIDFQALKDGGVSGVGIRLNDMNGGHHMDTMFSRYWEGAKGMVRFPYFVYNPWVSANENYSFLRKNMPPDAHFVAIDIEVRYSNVTSFQYASEINQFLSMCGSGGYKTIIYTGGGYIDLLSVWPKVDFWWAQYPIQAAFFSGVKTWDDLKSRLSNLDLPFNSGYIPGNLKMWQFSGDYLILPGSIKTIDANIFYGTEQQLAEYFGNAGSVSAPVTPTPQPTTGTSTPSNLYMFSTAAYWKRPSGGPLVTQTYKMDEKMKQVDKMIPVGSAWLNYLKATNTDTAFKKIIASDWGPSQGFNGNGLLKFLTLIYPGRNVVRIIKTEYGVDGQLYGLVDGLYGVPDSTTNFIDTPHLVHTVYGSGDKWSWFPLANSPHVPLIGAPRWVEMKWLVSIDAMLPKTVRVNVGLGLNVREKPDVNSTRVGYKAPLQSVVINDIRIAKGGIWGGTSDGWIALRFNDNNLTDWRI